MYEAGSGKGRVGGVARGSVRAVAVEPPEQTGCTFWLASRTHSSARVSGAFVLVCLCVLSAATTTRPGRAWVHYAARFVRGV